MHAVYLVPKGVRAVRIALWSRSGGDPHRKASSDHLCNAAMTACNRPASPGLNSACA